MQRPQRLHSLDDHQAEGAVQHITLIGRHMWEAYTS
jgi:hypothetical protein